MHTSSYLKKKYMYTCISKWHSRHYDIGLWLFNLALVDRRVGQTVSCVMLMLLLVPPYVVTAIHFKLNVTISCIVHVVNAMFTFLFHVNSLTYTTLVKSRVFVTR